MASTNEETFIPSSGKPRKAYLRVYRSYDLTQGLRIIVFEYPKGRLKDCVAERD